MKKKLIFMFLLSNIILFQIGFLIFGLMNVFTMKNNISFGEELFNTSFNVNEFTEATKGDISFLDGKYVINNTRKDLLIKNNIWLQILDKDNKQIFEVNKPESVPNEYTTVELVDYKTYPWNSPHPATLAIDEINGVDSNNTLVIGFPIDKVFSHKLTFTDEGFKFQIIYMGMLAIALTLVIGYFFSKILVEPIGDIMDDIETLKEGKFLKRRSRDFLYKNVDENIHSLSEALNRNKIERDKIEEAKEQWIANIAHDLKTPLSSIKGYSELLSSKDYEITIEEAKRYGEIMEDKAEYMQSLIDDLSLIYKLKNKVLPFNMKKNNIVDITREVVIDILNSLEFSDREIKIDYIDENINILCDEKYIKRALNNFIINGLVHNSKDTIINIKIDKINEEVVINIKDNGQGISKENLENIFNRYYRGKNTIEGIKSSGLGMAISKEIIEGHDGVVNVNSIIGIGSEISVIFKTI